VAASAVVMIYDDVSRQWMYSGRSGGTSTVHIYKHVINNSFRVVGRNDESREVGSPQLLLFLIIITIHLQIAN